MKRNSQKKTVELNKARFTAVFFVNGRRVLSYGNVSRMEIIQELERKQKAYRRPVAVYLINQTIADQMEKGMSTSAITFENDEKLFSDRVESFKKSFELQDII